MKQFANILLGHAVVLIVGGFAAGCILGSRYFMWSWMHNHVWAWFLSVLTLPAVIVWFVLMEGLGSSMRDS